MQDNFLRHRQPGRRRHALVNELAAALGCDRVTLGLVDGGEIEVIAVSNSAEFKPQQELLRQIAAAMQEAVDQGNRGRLIRSSSGDPIRIVLAHADLHERSGHALASVALVSGGKAVGALLAEWRSAAPPAPASLNLLDSLACVLGPLIALRHRCRAAVVVANQLSG